MNKKLAVLFAALAAIVITIFVNNYGQPSAKISIVDETSVIEQGILGMRQKPEEVTKVYYKNELIGIVQHSEILEETRQKAYEAYYKKDFPNSTIRYDDDILFFNEKTYMEYADKDQEISDYLFDNDLFLVEIYQIKIGDKDVINVKDVDEFGEALREFAMNFISEGTFVKLERKEEIISLTTYGEQEVNMSIEEELVYSEARASASEIYKNKDEILMYLCYGKDPQLVHYTVQEYDTVEGIAAKYDMTTEQLITINPSIVSATQNLLPQTEVNVTYYKSPLTVVVEKERYVKEVIYQPETRYEVDDSLVAGSVVVAVDGSDGSRDTLYKDIYINGVLSSYKQVSTVVTKEPIQRVVKVGSRAVSFETGELNFRLPVNNPVISCDYYCYKGHTGVDFQDRYNRWGILYACESGVITANKYDSGSGWMYEINHGNGFLLRYGHMRKKGPLPIGTVVTKGQYLGDIGMTGRATGPHVHITIWINGVRVDPCQILPCEIAGRWGR